MRSPSGRISSVEAQLTGRQRAGGRSSCVTGWFSSPQAARRGLDPVVRQAHVAGLAHLGEALLGEVQVDEGRHGRVLLGLGVVDVDVQAPRERVRAVGDGLGRRCDATVAGVDLDALEPVAFGLVVGEAHPAERRCRPTRCPRR